MLLDHGATVELQDALGRSALMFAAGNCAYATLVALLDAGACMAQRDRRGRWVGADRAVRRRGVHAAAGQADRWVEAATLFPTFLTPSTICFPSCLPVCALCTQKI